MSPDVTGVLAGAITVAVCCAIYLWSEGSRRLHEAQDRSADRFDVFPDDDVMAVADAVQGRVEERVWPRSDQFLAEAYARVAAADAERAMLESWLAE